MPSPEMKRTLFFAFKTGKNKFRFFQLLAWKCRKINEVNIVSGKAVCDCARFKFESNCRHTILLNKKVNLVRLKEKFIPISIEWKGDKAPEKGVIVVFDITEDKTYALSPFVGDLSLFNLLWLLTKGETSLIKSISGYLNPERIFVELYESWKLNIVADNSAVMEVGNKVAPIEDTTHIIKGLLIDKDSLKSECDEADSVDESIIDEEVIIRKKTSDENVEKVKKDLPFWKKIKRPSPDRFYVNKDHWEQCLYAVANGLNVLLTGASGVGKSELCYLVAQAMNREIVAFNLGASSEPRTMLIGNTHFDKEKGTWFQESRFVRAVQSKDGIVLLDEITRATRSAFNILLPLLDQQGYLALDESEDIAVIHKAEGMCFMSTANMGMEYVGTDPLDKALKDRYAIIIDLSFPPESGEVRLLMGRCSKLKLKEAKNLVSIANHQRELFKEGEFQEMISTRMLLAAGTQIADGMSFKSAVKFCIENHFSTDGGDVSDRTKILQIEQKFGI